MLRMSLCLSLLIGTLSALATGSKSVLFLAGKPSHGVGEHEFHAGCKILAQALEASTLKIKTQIVYDVWPKADVFEGIDALVIYCDGRRKHMARGHEVELQALADRGVGMVFLHYAVDGVPGKLDDTFLRVLGGYYNKQSKNPIWAMKSPILKSHAITRGVKPFDLREEWYYKLKFGDITPILSAVPPEEGGVSYPLAWVHGTNVFGCTGGHFLSSWGQPDFRKLILNAIVWAAGSTVPEGGVVSTNPVVVKYKTILHAIAKGDPTDVRNHLLLGADVNQKNKQGWTPLHFCAVRGKTECARVLIKNGAVVDPLTGTQKTPLHFAAERNFLPLVKLLVESGANLSACDNEGWSPLHYAAEKDRIQVATYLIQKGAKVDLVSTRGGTPLHEASASASPEMIQLLLKSGADKTIKATNGKTPLDYAIELGNAPAAALLK